MAASVYYNHETDTPGDDVDYEGSIDEDALAATTAARAPTAAMKVDHSKLRKSTSEPPPECRVLIDRLKNCNRLQLLEELSKISTWTFGKCELGHWKEVLLIFDGILDEAAETECGNAWALKCDTSYGSQNRKLLLWVLHFTTLLIEHSFSRHTYKSMDKLLALLAASDMSVVLGVLNLLYMFSKRSNFITRMQCILRASLVSQLHFLAESWGGKENGFGLADCCSNDKSLPPSATTLHFEFHVDNTEAKDKDAAGAAATAASGSSTSAGTATSTAPAGPAASSTSLPAAPTTPSSTGACAKDPKTGETPRASKQSMTYIHVEHVDQLRKSPGEIMQGILALYNIPPEKEMLLFTHVRLAYHFSNYRNRLLCVQARLQALSVLVYANALQDSAHTLLYNGLLEELVELIELKMPYLVEIRSAALRTLTSIIHLDRNPHFPKKPGSRLSNIIDVTGASQYHGFLPVLVRNCISSLTSQTNVKPKTPPQTEEVEEPKEGLEFATEFGISTQPLTAVDTKGRFPLPLATALFSFLYHLASYESGGDALVSCGMMESLLQVINWHGVELEHITFVTRAVRVIDLITNVDMQAFYTHGGLQSFISRLDVEVNLCVSEHPYVLSSLQVEGEDRVTLAPNSPGASTATPASTGPSAGAAGPSEEDTTYYEFQYVPDNVGKTCLAQRTALLKSMLNFLKKALQDATFSEHIRHLMEGTLPTSLKHIISNAEYYGPSLFLLATDVVTVYVFQEPSLLSTIQDNGLTDVVLQALLVKDVPATREVLASLPNVFSALCLNTRGLQSFSKCKPFERLFKVLLSPTYLSAMRKRRSSDPLGDAATNLGNAMDELMRHQPSLKVNATTAIVQLLNELCVLGTDPKYVCWRPHSKSEASPVISQRTNTNATEGNSSDEEDEDEEEASTSSQTAQTENQENQVTLNNEKQPIALTEYILNVTKFVDAILSNNSTDDHCREFVAQNGLVPLLSILGLPNLPVDCPITNSAQAVASVCKSILNLAHESRVLDEGLSQLNEVLQRLTPLYLRLDMPRGSKLLHELANAPHLETAFSTASATPLLHAMSAAHGYVLMFVHVCRTGQNDIRTLSLQHWGSEEGLTVLKGLAELYTSLVWESTLLLALCSDDVIQSECDFGKEDMEKLNIISESKESKEGDNVASAMEQLTTNPTAGTSSMDVDVNETTNSNKPTAQQLKYIKPLLGASSRLGRALAELFGLLVKLCVGSPIRQRRGQNMVSTPALSSSHARSVATALNILLANGLNYHRLPPSPVPKFRLTFLICSVGFTSPMLFDEKKYPYHLMLHKFVALGGQVTFFNAFEWALSAGGTLDIETALENPNLPEGTGEFLDAWLTLLEKMVNPKAILDSPHVISTRTATTKNIVFDPLKYLMQIHSDAFNAVMLLWGRKPLPNYGLRMSDAILTILKHILRGERIIHEKLNKTDDNKSEATPAGVAAIGTSGATSTSTAPGGPNSAVRVRPVSDANLPEAMSESLNALLDMGFLRLPAMDALNRTINLEQATEYLLATPQVSMAPRTDEIDMSEDDQMFLAIAMSLGDNGSTSDGPKRKEIPKDPKPIPEKVIDEFTARAPDVCLELIETVPESVFRVCDLLVTIMKRNGASFKQNFIENLLEKIKTTTLQILNEKNNVTPEFWCQSDPSRRLAYYTHLYTLFYEVPSYFEFDFKLVYYFIELLDLAGNVLTEHRDAPIPKWLTPVLLLLDSFGKVSVSTQRKCEMHLATSRVWKWYDIVSGKWTKYSEANNKIINDAYWNGEQTVRITCGRRRYTISFTSMQQINEESNNNRPISMTPANLSKLADLDDTAGQPVKLTKKEASRCVELKTFTKEQAEGIVQRCTVLMKTEIDKDTLHAIMRVCLRLTQDFDIAKLFVSQGGIQCLLKYNDYKHAFSGFRTLATLLIRHSLEGPSILAYAMEKVIRGRTLATLPASYKELMFLLRSIGSAVTRNSRIFLDVAKNTLRIDNSRRILEEDTDSKLLLSTEPSNRSQAPTMIEKESTEAVYALLNALVRPVDDSFKVLFGMINNDSKKPGKNQAQQQGQTTNQAGTTASTRTSSGSTTASSCMFQRASDLLSNIAPAGDILNLDTQEERPKLTRTFSESSLETQVLEKTSNSILTKPNILKILADSVVSYAGVARLITDYVYDHNTCEDLQEDCTCLAFLFDKILPIDELLSDRECSNMCRTLIAGIASCNHAPEAQTALVTEVKAALVRALLMPESNEKHNRIQHITGIILSMIEQCPPVQQVRIYKSQTFNANVNNIARLMLRKGIFNDLARVPHCLDMSSPNFAATINSALKPMECLSKIVNQPVTGNITGSSARKRRRTYDVGAEQAAGGAGAGAAGAGGNASGTSTDVTNAQGEDVAEDAENTEHDLSAVASSLGGNFFNVHVNVLDEIVEQLLVDRGQNGSSGTMDIDDESNLVVFDEHERDATEELMSTDSGDSGDSADSGDSEDDVDDGEDENAENTLDGEHNDDDDDDENDEEEDEDDVEEEEDDERGTPLVFDENEELPNMDRDEDIVMLQYADQESEHDSLPRMVRWNENGFTIPTLQFDESNNTNDQAAPTIHPLLVSRQTQEAAVANMARARSGRTRRYQYFQLNTRNANPPVILQRLLGPAGRNLHIGASNVFNSNVNVTRGDSARVVVMDNIGLFPSVEEQIDFVDQTGYIFGPSMLATINHIPVVLHWWKEESRFIDGDSMHDIVTTVSNDLIPSLVKHKKQVTVDKRTKAKTFPFRTSTPDATTDNTPFWAADEIESANPNNPNANQNSINPPQVPALAPGANNEEQPFVASPLELPLRSPYFMLQEEARPDPPVPPPIELPLWITPPHEMIDLSGFDQNEAPPAMQPEQDEDEVGEAAPASQRQDDNQRQEVDIVVSENPSFSPDSHSSTCEEDSDFFRRNYPQEQDQTQNRIPQDQEQDQEHTMTEETNNQTLTSMNADNTITESSVAATAEDLATTQQGQANASTSNLGNEGSTGVTGTTATRIEADDEIPDGVDPSFLEALPPEMRREVLEQHRMLRLQERISATSVPQPEPTASGSSEVSPEFLAALPPSLQEEVLTQQRLEQQRQAATRANPDEPVDAASFFETLQPSLRTMILSDMEDSQMSALPPDLAAEAQVLRRDWEARNRQLQVQERFLEANLTTIIRHTGRGRLASRFNTAHLLPQWAQRPDFSTNHPAGSIKIRGRQLLDHEALSCLLVLLFVDDPKLNTSRLHRVIRNLCHHVPTRDWVVRALLSIIDRSVHVKPDDATSSKAKKVPKAGPLSSKLATDSKNMGNGANWLNIRMEAALGCHANVFIVNRAPGKRTEKNSSNSSVTIHSQAAPIVCRNALDIFTSLSRTFPTFLLPLKPKDKTKDKPPAKNNKTESTDFWDMLLKLDAASTKKGKSLNKAHSNFNLGTDTDNFVQSFEQSAFGALLGMLSSNVIKGSIQLTDKLLRLLSVISTGMPELSKGDSSSATKTIAQNYESVAAPEAALNLAVNVLTYKSCSEEGLEDVTALLLNLSTCSLEMSRSILNLLLLGAKRIGEIVQGQISNMLTELQKTHTKPKTKEEPSASTSKGILNNRFTNEHVVITASSKVKTSCDLQLPSMAPLTSKSSSQVFFLRVLRVIVQIREAITNKKGPDGVGLTLGPLSEQLEDSQGLWHTLSFCLLELEHTPDHHAVLVLQPAVEAFFLVHSPPQETTDNKTPTAATGAAANAPAGAAAATPQAPVQAQGQGQTPQAAAVSQTGQEPAAAEGEALVSLTLSDIMETSGKNNVQPEHQKFLTFAEMHRTVLNQILRQTTSHLADGPFSVLVDHTRVLDFDIKRRYFRTELDRLDQNIRREETAVHVRREHVFEDSFRELYRRSPEEWKNRFYIVFEDEEGQDAGGLLREWYVIISRDIFNPMYALFTVSPGDRVTYMINSASHYNPNHLCYYKFVGRVIAKAIYDNKLLECYFTRSFYKHILGIPVKYTDMESEDYSFYRGLVYLMENNINNFDCDLSFSTEINEFGVTETRDLIPNGRNVPVTEENKMEYVRRSCQMKMTGAIRQQLTAFLEGFYDIIPKRLISIFNEQELELLISGLPNVDIEDLKANSEYHKYQANSLQIQWFWRALRSFDQADRAKFLQFVTGTSKVPLQGFGALEGMNGVQKFQIHRDDRSTDRLPSAHTCFNQLDLPVYETYDKLRSYLLKAIHECSEGFGFA